MPIDTLLRPRAGQIRAVVRAVARGVPVNMTTVRFWPQPTAPYIARLSVTAVFAYLHASLVPGSSQPALAPLRAVLVVQVPLSHTVRSAVQRVASVVAGVLVALALSAAVGFTWWSLGVTIAAALAIGSMLRLGDHILEVPISAMLILSLNTKAAASGRVVGTPVRAAAGLGAGVLPSPRRTHPAQQPIRGPNPHNAG